MNNIRNLYCACCGGHTTGRQFHNQDTGYGLCAKCATWIRWRTWPGIINVQAYMIQTYGVEGVNYNV